jgi:hypothetical protein
MIFVMFATFLATFVLAFPLGAALVFFNVRGRVEHERDIAQRATYARKQMLDEWRAATIQLAWHNDIQQTSTLRAMITRVSHAEPERPAPLCECAHHKAFHAPDRYNSAITTCSIKLAGFPCGCSQYVPSIPTLTA